MLRDRPVEGPRSIEEQRAGYAALMSAWPVQDGIRTAEVDLGDLRALLIEPDRDRHPGGSDHDRL